MGKTELMQEKIEQQRKLPQEIKSKLDSIDFRNLLISIGIMIYMILVNILFINESETIFSTTIKIFACTLAFIDIILFEISYRQDNGTLAIHSIELLCISLFSLTIPYIYIYLNPIIRQIIMLTSLYVSIYYVGKLVLIHIIEKNKYINNLSDVLEILQDEEDDTDISESEIINDVQELNKKVKQEKVMINKKRISKKEKNND